MRKIASNARGGFPGLQASFQLTLTASYSTSLDTTNWTKNEQLLYKSTRRTPHIVTHAGKVHMVYVGKSSAELWHSEYDGVNWTVNQKIPDQTSSDSPAVASYNGRIHIVHIGESSTELWHSAYNTATESWSSNVKIPEQKSKAVPALAAYAGKLHMVHLGKSSNDLWHSTYSANTNQWTENVKIPEQKSFAPPALASFSGKLHMVHVGDGSEDLWHSTFTESGGWTTNVKLTQKKSKDTPALFEHNKRLHMVHQGDSSNDLWHTVFDGSNWSSDKKISDQKSAAPPSLTNINGILCMAHRGDNHKAIWFSSYREIRPTINLSQPDREQLIAKYAPMVFFHPDETAFPSSIDWYLPQVELKHRGSVLISPPNLNMHNLVSQVVNGEFSGALSSNNHFYTKIVDDETRKGNLDSAKCYVHLRRAPTSDAIDIQYWFFSPDNPFNVAGIGKHEGDWEHVTVRVTSNQRHLLGVYYSIHKDGRWIMSPELTGSHSVGFNHPKVFVAKGSHASYPSAGSFSVHTPLPGITTTDHTSENGETWLTRFKTVDVGERSQIRNNQSWLRFTGTWGASQGFADSPETPSFKAKWEDDGGGPLEFHT